MSADQMGTSASRARDRASWPVRVRRLGAEPSDDLSLTTTAEERLAMLWPLTLDAWALTGRQIPDYARSETPIRVVVPARRPGATP